MADEDAAAAAAQVGSAVPTASTAHEIRRMPHPSLHDLLTRLNSESVRSLLQSMHGREFQMILKQLKKSLQ